MEMITVTGVGIWIAFLPPSGSVTDDKPIPSTNRLFMSQT